MTAACQRHPACVRLDFYTMNADREPDWLAELAKGGEVAHHAKRR